MTVNATQLDGLRREIDEIDDRLLELLTRRAEMGEQVAKVKGPSDWPNGQIKPGREARILRRLLANSRGALPRSVIARIWRELISANCRLQGPLSVAVNAPERSVSYWDMARRHYGSSTPMTLHRSAQNVLRAVAGGHAAVGVLPLPQDHEADPWWPQLASAGENAPRVIARLPFYPEAGQLETVAGLVVARIEPEPSGDDVSLLAIWVSGEISRARLTELLNQAELPGHSIAGQRDSEARAELHLMEVAGFLTPDDARLSGFLELARSHVQSVVPLGAYARPMALE